MPRKPHHEGAVVPEVGRPALLRVCEQLRHVILDCIHVECVQSCIIGLFVRNLSNVVGWCAMVQAGTDVLIDSEGSAYRKGNHEGTQCVYELHGWRSEGTRARNGLESK